MLTKDNVTIGIEWRFGPVWPGQRCGTKTRRGTACQRPANNHKNGTFYHGIMQFKNFELAPNQAQALARTRQSFEKAEALGKIDSKFFLYLIEREEINIGQRSNYTTIKKLIEAAEIQNDSQAMAAFTLALLYKKGVALPKDLEKYMLHLRVSADLGLANAALLLGKALSIGVLSDPDYEEARFYLELAQKKEMKGADFLLSQLETQEKREQAAESYQAPKFWQEHLWAAQAFSGLPSSDIEKDEASSDIFSSGEWRSNKVVDLPTMVRSRRTGKNIYGSDGSRYRIRGDTIRSSDGTRFKVKGDSIRASNGVRYKIRGKTIRGSDGTRCRISGKYTRCY